MLGVQSAAMNSETKDRFVESEELSVSGSNKDAGAADAGTDPTAEDSTGTREILDLTLFNKNADERVIGRILVEAGKLSQQDADRIADLQQREGVFFGEAAKRLNLVSETDIQYALARQFNYTFLDVAEGIFSPELVTAYQPFSAKSESLRAIRGQLSHTWLNGARKALAIVSPDENEGKTFLAANLAVLFAQQQKRTLLIDANLRSPRMQQVFKYQSRVGLSAMLAGRVQREDLDRLPETVPFFTHLSVLGAGAAPPNPLELLAGARFAKILQELGLYYDVILIDTPAATKQSDAQTIAACAGSALLVSRKDHTKSAHAKKLLQMLSAASVHIAGAVLNDF